MQLALRFIVDNWNKIWFSEVPPTAICLFRILYGLLALSLAAMRAPQLMFLYGPQGLLSIDSVEHVFHVSSIDLWLWHHVNNTGVILLFAAYVIAALFVTVGFQTRLSSITLWLLMCEFYFRNPRVGSSHGDVLLVMCGLIVALAPAGRAFSIDKHISNLQYKQQKDLLIPCWTQKLLQLQMVTVYWQAAISKLVGNTKWLDGTAVYYFTHTNSIVRFHVPYLFDHAWTYSLITWGTIVVELALATFVWFKCCRYWVLLAGIILHLGLDCSLRVPLFQMIMMSLYILFVYPKDLDGVVAYLNRKKSVKRLANLFLIN